MYEQRKEPNYLLIIFIFVELIFLAVAGIIISNLFTSDNITTNPATSPAANITNSPPFLSSTESGTISRSLYSLMLQNTDTKQLLNQDAFATVSDDLTYHFKNQGLTLFSAILDAPNLDQSYKLFYSYPDEDNDSFQQFTSIICIEAPVTPCASLSDHYSEIDIAHNFLPYIEFDEFTAYFSSDKPQEININPILSTNGNADTEDAYIDEVKSAIRALGLSPNSFTYHVLTPADYDYTIY